MKGRRTLGKKVESSGIIDQLAPSAADFSFALTRVAISQICQSVGFRFAESSAIETLTVIATKYFQALAGLAASFSNAANRTESNLFDVVNALHELCLPQGFPGGSTLYDRGANCLIHSSVLRDLSDFVNSITEIPFAKPFPSQADQTGEKVPQALESDAPPRGTHVPDWLPAFPDIINANEEPNLRQRSDKLWENSKSVYNTSKCDILMKFSESDGGGGRKNGGGFPEKREKVKFKLRGGGVEVRSGACRGGKRVRWWDKNNNANNANDGSDTIREVKEDDKKKKKKKRKR